MKWKRKEGLIMSQCLPEFKKRIIRLYEEEGQITAEYGVSQASISKWWGEFSKEYLIKAQANAVALIRGNS